MINLINFNTKNYEFNQQITKRDFPLQRLDSVNNSIAFQARNKKNNVSPEKDMFCRSEKSAKLVNQKDTQNTDALLNTVKGIKLSPDGTDKTINGYFEIVKTEIPKTPKHIKINGKRVELPDPDNYGECWKWWNKYVSTAPLSVSKEDREKAELLAELPSNIKERIIVSLSKRRTNLTAYDNTELVKYRTDLNKRRILLDTREAKATKKGQAVVEAVSNKIYDNYANSPEGIKKEKKLIVMIGQKASGKTTLVNKMREEYGVLVGDSDDVRDGYIGSQETELHGRLKFAVKQNLEERAIKEGANYLAQFHGTGTKSTLNLIEKFKGAGYDVEVKNLEVPAEELVKRIAARKERSGKDADPLSVIMCGEDEQLAHFRSIVEKAEVSSDRAKRYYNGSDKVKLGEDPIVIDENETANIFSKKAA